MMKICYLGDAPSPHVRKFVDYFAKKGNEIYVISLRKAEYKNAIVLQLRRRTPFDDMNYLLGFWELKGIIKSINPDIIHAHYLTSFGLLGALVRFHPFIVTAWGTDLLVTPKKLFIYRWLLKYTLNKADLIFADANFMQDELLHYGATAEKILICPFGVDLEALQSWDREFKESDRYKILSMRTLIKNSNIDAVIKAVKILKDRGISVILNITNRGEEEKSLKQMTLDLKLGACINFLGFIKLEEIYMVFKNSDIYLSIPSSDGASVTLLEAMASGLFPIVSDIPANREWIVDGVNGFLVPQSNSFMLAERIISALEQPFFRREAAKINRDIVRRKGELGKTMELIWKQYKTLVNSNQE